MQTIKSDTNLSIRKSAIIAGVAYLVAIFITPYSWINPLIILGDDVTTFTNITSNIFLFRLAIVFWFIVLIADSVVGWALFYFFKETNRAVSLLALYFRLLFVPMMILAVFQWVDALLLIGETSQFSGEVLADIQHRTMSYFIQYEYAVNIAFAFFGLHVGLIGYLAYKSGVVPRWLGIFLMVACVGYQIDGFASFLSPAYASYPNGFLFTIAIPAFCSEFIFTLWLLLKGSRLKPAGNAIQ